MAAGLRHTVLINVLITIALLGLLELRSWAALSIHEGNIASRNEAMLDGQAKPAAPAPETTAYSDPEVRRDLDRSKEAGYRHEPFLVYLPNAFASKHVNITAAGFRLNGAQRYPATIHHKVWVFGSSALYGVSNADGETIPAQVERPGPGPGYLIAAADHARNAADMRAALVDGTVEMTEVAPDAVELRTLKCPGPPAHPSPPPA